MNYKTNTRSATARRSTPQKKTSSKNISSKSTIGKTTAGRNRNNKDTVLKTNNHRSNYSSSHVNTYHHYKSNGARSKKKISSKNIKRSIPRKAKSPRINRNIAIAMKPKQMDYAIFFTVIILVMFGVIMIFSASYYRGITNFGDKYHFLKSQAMAAGIGFLAMMFMTFFDYRKLKKYAIPAYMVSNILLVLVLFIGQKINGKRRWLWGFQPSEIAKLALILLLAYIIDKNPKLATTWKGFFKCMFIIGIPALLVALQNLSTAIVIAAIGCIVVFIAGAKITYFLPMIIPIGALIPVLFLIPEFLYRLNRIKIWLDPFSDPLGGGFQTIQSLLAIASGGLFGRGLGNSVQKLGYIPEAYNDIIFSIVCEELGLVGAGGLILLFIILISRGISTSLRAKDMFASLTATGITSMVAIQAIINIAVVTNTIPNTGMPLPFISYGGTSLCILMSCMGILLNISCYTKS